MEENGLSYTLEREYVKHGCDFKIYHVPTLGKPYMFTFKLPSMENKDSYVIFLDNFAEAHKTFNRYKKMY